MNNSVPLDQQNGFRRYLGYSFFFHIAILALLVLKAVIYPSEPLQLEKSMRVDIVGLPDKVQKLTKPAPPEDLKPKEIEKASRPDAPAEVAKIPPKEAPKVVLNKKESKKVDLHKTKEAQANALKRLEALSRIEKMAAQEKAATVPRSQPVRGNTIAAGSSLTGIDRLNHENYVDLLDEHIKKHWVLPEWLANASLKARVLVFVDERGFVIKKQMIQPSHNPIFDEKVLEAIDRASPFPAPPPKLRAIFAVDGVEFGFPE